jgi:voltage-gated potassium channel
MLKQILFALALAGVTVMLHAVGTVSVVIPAAGVWRLDPDAARWRRSVWSLTCLVSLLLVLHLVEMTVWAVAYAVANVFSDFETSLYFSMKSYTTVGYGDVLPKESWRLLGPMEAAIGVLMLGWSTAIIVAVVQRIFSIRHTAAPPDS